LFRRLSEDESVELHARFVDPHHRRIGLQVALVENGVEYLRHQAAIGDGHLVAKDTLPVLALLREKRLHHLEAFGDSVAVPGVHALLVELVRFADVFPHTQVVERMDLAAMICEKART
jgi:GNAT superfamily N-acetyltransferase